MYCIRYQIIAFEKTSYQTLVSIEQACNIDVVPSLDFVISLPSFPATVEPRITPKSIGTLQSLEQLFQNNPLDKQSKYIALFMQNESTDPTSVLTIAIGGLTDADCELKKSYLSKNHSLAIGIQRKERMVSTIRQLFLEVASTKRC